MEICVTSGFSKKRTRNEAILELLDTIYKILDRFYYELSKLYKLEEIKIEDKKEDGYIAFILLGQDKETLEQLKITIMSWYYRDWYYKEKQEN